jgi:hypothetical protein
MVFHWWKMPHSYAQVELRVQDGFEGFLPELLPAFMLAGEQQQIQRRVLLCSDEDFPPGEGKAQVRDAPLHHREPAPGN